MNVKNIGLALSLVLGLSACATGEPATRALGVEALTIASQGGPMRGSRGGWTGRPWCTEAASSRRARSGDRSCRSSDQSTGWGRRPARWCSVPPVDLAGRPVTARR